MTALCYAAYSQLIIMVQVGMPLLAANHGEMQKQSHVRGPGYLVASARLTSNGSAIAATELQRR